MLRAHACAAEPPEDEQDPSNQDAQPDHQFHRADTESKCSQHDDHEEQVCRDSQEKVAGASSTRYDTEPGPGLSWAWPAQWRCCMTG